MGNKLIDGSEDLIHTLRRNETSVFFMSNNSSKWKNEYAEKLNHLGIDAEFTDIILSTDSLISYLKDNAVSEAYVVGTESFRNAIRDAGINPVSKAPESVVIGFDTELTYNKVRDATLAIQNGAEFLLAHPDKVCPTPEGFVPDAGSISALIETATNRAPDQVFGKPNPNMINHVMANKGLTNEEIAVVGDRLSTDMQLAANIGVDSVCVLTGDATREEIENSDLTPAVAPSVGSILNWWL